MTPKCNRCKVDDCINCDGDIPMNCCCSHEELDKHTASLLKVVGIGALLAGFALGMIVG